MSAGARTPIAPLLSGAATAAVVLYAAAPVLWVVSLSLKPAQDLSDRRLVPARTTFEHYLTAWSDPHFPAAIANSIGIGAAATLIALALATLAAYAIVRLSFPGRGALMVAILSVAMLPPIAIAGPLFDLWRRIGLFDTWPGLVLPYVALTLPLAIWLLVAYFRDLPWELEAAARVDGATRWGALRRVMLPLAAPGLVTAGLLVFIFAWNDFLFAATLTSTDRARTAPVAIAFFTGASRFELPIGAIAAASIVITLPVLLLVIAFQRRIVAGLTAGAVKG